MFIPSFSLIGTKLASLSGARGRPDISQLPLQLGVAKCLRAGQHHMSRCVMCNTYVVLLKRRCGPIVPLVPLPSGWAKLGVSHPGSCGRGEQLGTEEQQEGRGLGVELCRAAYTQTVM